MSEEADRYVSENEKQALREFANELSKELAKENVQVSGDNLVSKLRWYPNKAGAVVIVSRDKGRRVLATISPKRGKWTHLYPSWIPVLEELASKKQSANVSRMTHKDLKIGEIPE